MQEKLTALKDSMERAFTKGQKVLVICKSVKSAQRLCAILTKDTADESRQLIDLMHGDLLPKQRQELLTKLTDQTSSLRVLVTTDLITRGWDPPKEFAFSLIQWDMARNLPEYLHRTGRVGRLGQTKNVSTVSLVGANPRAKRLTELIKLCQTQKLDMNVLFEKLPKSRGDRLSRRMRRKNIVVMRGKEFKKREPLR